MKSNAFVLDTNFILGYLRGIDDPVRFLTNKDNPRLYISDITRLELLSFSALDDKEKAEIVDFLDKVEIISLTHKIGDIAIAFRSATNRKLPDAIIAATAIFLAVPLVTSDKELANKKYPGFTTIEP